MIMSWLKRCYLDMYPCMAYTRGFEVHERDSHVHRMMMTLYGLLLIPRDLYSRIEELTCMNLYLCDFGRHDTLVGNTERGESIFLLIIS